ncbi:MAG: tetratricopeptide repeat protein [Oligoflexia bacterium]|nr:tetratricopeptide repeat protein [Oligoflexia bacterium]
MDDLSKEEIEFSKSLQDLRFLIADASSGRRSIRKLLSHFRVKANLIEVADTAADAVRLLQEKRPHIVFADDSIGEDGAALGLVETHARSLESERLRVFFLMTARESNAMVTGAAVENVDSVLVKPYTFDVLSHQFHRVLTEKINPTPYADAVQAGKALLERGQYQEAIEAFREAMRLDPRPALACSYLGAAFEAQGEMDQAEEAYLEGLASNPVHFRCLGGLLDCLLRKNEIERAYEVGRKIVEHHVVPMKRVPDMIRLSVLNHKFEDVLGFFGYSDALARADKGASIYLAAGLVVCGLYFLQRRDLPGATDAFRKADVVAQGNPKVQKRILMALVSAGLEGEVNSYAAKLPPELKNCPEVRIAELRRLAQNSSPAKVVERARELVRNGIKDKEVYALLLEKSKQIALSDALLEGLFQDAVRDFPQERAYFENALGASGRNKG